MKITLYSTNCPKCKVLETKLQKKNIQYEVNHDIEYMISKGMMSAPYLEIDEQLYSFGDAIKWVNDIPLIFYPSDDCDACKI